MDNTTEMQNIIKKYWDEFGDALIEILNGNAIECEALDDYCKATNTKPNDSLAINWLAFICGINAGEELSKALKE